MFLNAPQAQPRSRQHHHFIGTVEVDATSPLQLLLCLAALFSTDHHGPSRSSPLAGFDGMRVELVLALDTCEASGTPLSLANRRGHLREILNEVHLEKSSVKCLALFLSGKPTLVSVIPPSCEASSL